MKGDRKGAGKLATYAVIMLLAAIIIIIIAAMADDREQQFKNQIYQTTQANATIQNEIVALKDDNYFLTQENNSLKESVEEYKSLENICNIISEALKLSGEKKIDEAKAKLGEIDKETLPENLNEIYTLAEKTVSSAKN